MSIIDPKLLKTIVASPCDAASLEANPCFEFKSGNTYSGGIVGGTTMHGGGTYKWADTGVTYDGEFSANEISGTGRYVWPDGSVYEGEVRGGIRHGVGVFSGPGGFPMYDGQWCEGRRHGSGVLTYSDGGDVYDGEWENDERSGAGTLTHASGNLYVGAWKADAKNGRGTFHWHDVRERYSGEWRDGKPHGHGEHIWLRAQVCTCAHVHPHVYGMCTATASTSGCARR